MILLFVNLSNKDLSIGDVNSFVVTYEAKLYFGSMIEKEIFIVRHGQTDLNAMGIVQGKGVNHSLNDLGRSQAQAFYQAYKHLNPDVMYSSTLKRAQETLTPFHPHNIPHIIDEDLDEISWGKAEGVGGLSVQRVYQACCKNDIANKSCLYDENFFQVKNIKQLH